MQEYSHEKYCQPQTFAEYRPSETRKFAVPRTLSQALNDRILQHFALRIASIVRNHPDFQSIPDPKMGWNLLPTSSQIPTVTDCTGHGVRSAFPLTHTASDNQSITMSDRNYSPYQQKVIQRYYDNREQMDEQRLAELVTNLYLAPPKKQAKLWESAEELMTRMLIPATRIAHVMKTKDAAVLAKVVEEIQKGVLKRDPPPKKTS